MNNKSVGKYFNEFTGESLSVIELTTPIFVTITDDDVKKGVKGDQQFCMKARAINRSIGVDPDNVDEVRRNGARVFAHGATLIPLTVRRGNKLKKFLMRGKGPSFGNGFDKGKHYVGQTFKIRPPSHSETLIAKRIANSKRTNRGHKPKTTHRRQARRQVRQNWSYKSI